MNDTDSYEADVPVTNLAEGYTRRAIHGIGTMSTAAVAPGVRTFTHDRHAAVLPGGGYSTASDLLRFTQTLVGDRLLSPPYTDWMLAGAEPQGGQSRTAGAPAGGGLGIAGGAPGIHAALEFDVATGNTVVVMSNFDPPAAMEFAKRARPIVGAIRK